MYDDRLALKPREACKLLGISLRTLWQWTKEGRIPHVRIKRVLRYPRAELEAWLRQQAKGTRQAQPNPPSHS